jgi:hypothetical protein
MENQQQEKVFHSDSNVTVTQSRFMASGRTYTMRNISSVTVFKVEKSKKLPIALLIVGCLIALAGGSASVLGIAMAIAGIIWLFMIKNDYAVRISTNAGESNSLTSANRDYVQKIVNALNEAIIHRG